MLCTSVKCVRMTCRKNQHITPVMLQERTAIRGQWMRQLLRLLQYPEYPNCFTETSEALPLNRCSALLRLQIHSLQNESGVYCVPLMALGYAVNDMVKLHFWFVITANRQRFRNFIKSRCWVQKSCKESRDPRLSGSFCLQVELGWTIHKQLCKPGRLL